MAYKRKQMIAFFNKSYYTILIIFSGLILFSVLPKQVKFKYEYQKGKPWSNQTVIAQFDFPILKSNAVFQAEKDSIINEFVPFYRLNPEVFVRQNDRLSNEVNVIFDSDSKSFTQGNKKSIVESITKLLFSFYDRGIIDNSVDMNKELENKKNLVLLSNNEARQVSVNEIISLKNAYIQLNDTVLKYKKTNQLLSKVLQKIDLRRYLEANIFYDEALNESKLNDLLDNFSNVRGMIQAGERIVSQGEIVDDRTFSVVESYRIAFENRRSYGSWYSLVVLGQIILISVLLGTLILYLRSYNASILKKRRNLTFILTVVVFVVLFASFISKSRSFSIYMMPFCILPIIIRTFVGARMAIFTNLITMLMIGLLVFSNTFEFVFMQFIAGTVAVISLNKLHRRGHLIITAFLILITYSVIYIGFSFLKESNLESVKWSFLSMFVVNSVLVLTAYPLIYIFERAFGFVSDITLLELADTNNPLLRKLSEEAPGTFQHSMQVSNLAEEAVVVLGGNSMLVRAGALYHDIGKMANSNYFIENQMAGQNPHDSLDYKQSASVIINHIQYGVELAKKYKLPEKIIDFIRMHHGNGMTRYFYLKYEQEHPGETIDIKDFKYPGPSPKTLEVAILMLADSVEAASRSLQVKNEESLKAVIEKIFDEKIENHELDNAPLTLKDLKRIKEIFLKKLKNIYHIRIEYPERQKRGKE